jgi:hypothetical protein
MPAKKSNPKKKLVSQTKTSKTTTSTQKAEAYLMDTNVILVANRDQKEVSEECIHTCLRWIADLKNGGYKLVLDESGLILEEYRKKWKKDKSDNKWKPDEGDDENGKDFSHSKFMIWLLQNSYNMIRVPITQGKKPDEFKEFPNDTALKNFEGADRKFVATAISYERIHHKKSPILEACDTDYKEHQKVLEEYIDIEFICPDDIEKLFTRKKSK